MNEALQSIKGVGPSREKQFHKLGITTVTALLTYFPRTYEDRSKIYAISELTAGIVGSVIGTVVKIQEKKPRRGLSILELFLTDEPGKVGLLKVVLFNQGYKKNFYKTGIRLHVFGKVEFAYGSLQMNSPQMETVHDGMSLELGIVPVYSLVDGVNQYSIRQSVKNWFASHHELPEILPLGVLEKHHLMPRYQAFKEMHYPTSLEMYNKARQQLAYEELFIMQTGLLLLKAKGESLPGVSLQSEGHYVNDFLAALPFTLTKDQQKAFKEISYELASDIPMQKLLQGDVGSGKTVVGILSLLKCAESGYQGAFMAPTEILATQHYENMCKNCQHLPVKIRLLVGSTKNAEREVIYEELTKGEIDILIGTHALIQDRVVFKNLALIVIDEQHRFGVKQRATLQNKGLNPHVLIMTATPIPRTMALSVYGDLSVSLIKEKPPGRKKVSTYVVNSTYKQRLLTFFAKEMQAGRQVYVVCPLVEESETLDLKAAEEIYFELVDYFKPKYEVGLLHGRMSGVDKEFIMNQFHDKKLMLLVSTTVIEVGVDVPNATIMCITGAERFGLSQLHQLRGRVGRGQAQAYCILVSDSKSEESLARLKLMEKTDDGFELAEQDLLMRGSGQLFGYVQHGLPDLKVANIIKDVDLLTEARKDSKRYIASVGAQVVKTNLSGELTKRFGENFIQILYS